jgi:hypothetical protein
VQTFFQPLDLTLEICPLIGGHRGSIPFEIRLESRHDAQCLGPALLAETAIEFRASGSDKQQSVLYVPLDKIAPNSIRVRHYAMISRLYANVPSDVNC